MKLQREREGKMKGVKHVGTDRSGSNSIILKWMTWWFLRALVFIRLIESDRFGLNQPRKNLLSLNIFWQNFSKCDLHRIDSEKHRRCATDMPSVYEWHTRTRQTRKEKRKSNLNLITQIHIYDNHKYSKNMIAKWMRRWDVRHWMNRLILIRLHTHT